MYQIYTHYLLLVLYFELIKILEERPHLFQTVLVGRLSFTYLQYTLRNGVTLGQRRYSIPAKKIPIQAFYNSQVSQSPRLLYSQKQQKIKLLLLKAGGSYGYPALQHPCLSRPRTLLKKFSGINYQSLLPSNLTDGSFFVTSSSSKQQEVKWAIKFTLRNPLNHHTH